MQPPRQLQMSAHFALGTSGSLWARYYTLEETIWCSRERAYEAKHEMLLHMLSISLILGYTVFFFFNNRYCDKVLYHPDHSYVYFKSDSTH